MSSSKSNGIADITNHFKMVSKELAQTPKTDELTRLWLDLSDNLPDSEPIVKQHDINVCTLGNFSCITGQAKSRKTFLITALTGAFLCEDEYLGFSGTTDAGTVLYIDTEQSKPHVMRTIRRIHRIAGFDDKNNHDRLRVLCLRELSPKERVTAITKAMRLIKPVLCVIDGVADLMADTNSNIEAVEIATMLLQLTSKYNCHITTVVHTNFGSDKARGHIGSEIIRKAETVLHVTKEGNASKVTAAYCRDIELQDFAFVINDSGLPEVYETIQKTPKKSTEIRELFEAIIPLPTTMDYKDIIEKIKEVAEVKDRQARNKLKEAIDGQIVIKNSIGSYHLKQKEIEDELLPF